MKTKIPRKLKKALKTNYRVMYAYGKVFNRIFAEKGYDKIPINIDEDSEDYEECAEADKKRIDECCDLALKELHQKHRFSHMEHKAHEILSNWHEEEAYEGYTKSVPDGKYTDVINQYWNELTKDW